MKKSMACIIAIVIGIIIISLAIVGCDLAGFGSKGNGNSGGGGSSATRQIGGELHYDSINQKSGEETSTIQITPTLVGVTDSAQTITYSIDPALPTGASISPTDGIISLPTSVTSTNITETYTVTATGTGEYSGSITAPFKLHLAPHALAGSFTYADTRVNHLAAATITPTWTGATSGQTTEYVIANTPTGITIASAGSSAGTVSVANTTAVQEPATYTITAWGTGQYGGSITSSIKISILGIENPVVTAYNTTSSSDADGAIIGPFIKDSGFTGTSTVLTIGGLSTEVQYTYTLGSASGNKTAVASRITITRADIAGTNAADGAKLTLSGGRITGSEDIATYKPLEIHGWQDLQAMRLNLAGTYILKRDVTFPAPGTDGFPTAGFEPIGDGPGTGTTAFTGRLDGNNKKIINLVIEDPALFPAGLFGHIAGASPTTQVVKNLTIEDPKILAKCQVGALAGAIRNATVTNIAVIETNITDAHITANSSCVFDYDNASGIALDQTGAILGGIIGVAYGSIGGTTDHRVNILNSYSKGINIRSKTGNIVGGLAGAMLRGRLVGYSSNDIVFEGATGWMIGGLVGNAERGNTIIGSFSGTIVNSGTKIQYIGGLVGLVNLNNAPINVYGYFTGTLDGRNGSLEDVGGLVGRAFRSNATAIIRGYSSGTIKKAKQKVGGLLGSSNTGATNLQIDGYNRGIIQLMTATDVGYIYGNSFFGAFNNQSGFYSTAAGEGVFQNTSGAALGTGTSPTLAAATAAGAKNYQGTGLSVSGATPQSAFTGFTFNTTEGTWSFATGKWPKINLGSDYPSGASIPTQALDP